MKILKKPKLLEYCIPEKESGIANGTGGVEISLKKIDKEDGIAEGEEGGVRNQQPDRNEGEVPNQYLNPIPSPTKTGFVDENKSLTKSEKRVHYKFSKHVMAGRRIRELMNAHVRTKLKRSLSEIEMKPHYKSKLIVGLAITLQVIPIILIFI